MNAFTIARRAARLGRPAAAALALSALCGCGNGFFPEQRAVGGGGGGGGSSGTLTVLAKPPTALAITSQPGGGVTGMALTREPIVEVVDALDRQLGVSGSW